MGCTARTVRIGGGWRALQGPRCGAVLNGWRHGPGFRAVAGRLPSPRLVRPCRSPGWTFEVSRPESVSALRPRGRAAEPGPRGLRSSPDRVDIAVAPVHRPRSDGCSNHLPWDSSGGSPGPLHRHPPRRPLPAVLPPLRSQAAAWFAFRPHRFSRSRRFSPPKDSRACCIPLPIVGFDAFPRSIGWLPAPSDSAIAGRFRCRSPRSGLPRIVFRTPRRTPPPRSRTVSPRPLPSRTSPFPPSPTFPTLPLPAAPLVPMPERTLSLRALLREKVRTGAHLVQVGDSLSSLGLVPLRGCLLPRERPSLSRYLTPGRAARPCGRSAFRARLRRAGWVPCRRSG